MAGIPALDTVVVATALEGLRRLPDGAVDLAFADPPFNLGKAYGSYDDRRDEAEYLAWSTAWLREMARVTKPTGSVFVYALPKWLVRFSAVLEETPPMRFRHWIAWDARGVPMGRTLQPAHYGILWYVKSDDYKFRHVRGAHERCRVCDEMQADYGGKKWRMHPYGPLVGDVWSDIHRVMHARRRDAHPNQLPVPLLERILLMATDAGDVVLDPFMGTGTTAVAARHLGRHFLGFDNDPSYVRLATEKAAEAAPTRIGDAYVSLYLGRIVTARDEDFTGEPEDALASHVGQSPKAIEHARRVLPR